MIIPDHTECDARIAALTQSLSKEIASVAHSGEMLINQARTIEGQNARIKDLERGHEILNQAFSDAAESEEKWRNRVTAKDAALKSVQEQLKLKLVKRSEESKMAYWLELVAAKDATISRLEKQLKEAKNGLYSGCSCIPNKKQCECCYTLAKIQEMEKENGDLN